MPFEQVDNPNPIATPATPATNYNKLWITKILVESPTPASQSSATIVGIPWDGSTRTLDKPVITKVIPNIFGLAQGDPDVVTAINAILKVVNKYKELL